MSCPRCNGYIVVEAALSWRPEHVHCLMCGFYLDKPEVGMPMPPVVVDRVKQMGAKQAKKRTRGAS